MITDQELNAIRGMAEQDAARGTVSPVWKDNIIYKETYTIASSLVQNQKTIFEKQPISSLYKKNMCVEDNF
jgi:hypothetical protein